MKIILLIVFIASSLFAGSGSGAKKQLETFLNYLKIIKGVEGEKKLTKNDIKKNKQISSKAIQIVDIYTMSKRSLGPKIWKKIGTQKQNNFVRTLRRLVALNAFPRSHRFLNKVSYNISQPKIKKVAVDLRQTVTIKGDDENPEDTEMLIDYTLEKRKGVWRLVNVSFDEVSLVDTYSNQFASIINKKGFSYLYSLMLKKKKELEKEYGSVIPK